MYLNWIFLFLCLFISSLIFFSYGTSLNFSSLTYPGIGSFGHCLFFSWNADGFSSIFLTMVFLVLMLVLGFSSVYMETYDSFKFMFILILFVFSMAFLSLSSSFLSLSVGWDFLGLSSIFLIMFYPNKVTGMNSFITFFLNRLSDVALILCFSLILSSVGLGFHNNGGVLFLSVLSICAFVKSAQFPLSTWLPAAMSAPTPVSALVHSSTLVAAGLLIVLKLIPMTLYWGVGLLIFNLSCVSALVGGISSSVEGDLKKIIAFSTMSQISVVMIMGIFGLVSLSLGHMLFHSLFKSLLFTIAGFTFMSAFSSQIKSFLVFKNSSSWSFWFFMVSIFSMTGLVYSGSFFSKDFFLEIISSIDGSFMFVLFLAISLTTIFYCSKVIGVVLNSSTFFNYYMSFSKTHLLFFLFTVLTLLEGALSSFFLFSGPSVVFGWEILITSVIFLFFSFFFLIKFDTSLEVMSYESFFMKSTLFSFWGKISNAHSNLNFLNDELMFKKSLLTQILPLQGKRWWGWAFSVVMISILVHLYSHSFSNVVLKLPKKQNKESKLLDWKSNMLHTL